MEIRANLHIRIIAFLLFQGLVFSSAAFPEEASEPEKQTPRVTLWRVAPANFYESDFSTSQFRELVDKSLPRKVEVQQGDTLSGVIRRVFNVSSTWTPAVYRDLVTKIKATNRLYDENSLMPGQIEVPDIPKTSKTTPNENSPYRSDAKISFSGIGRSAMAWDPAMQAFSGEPSIAAVGREAAREEIQIRQVDVETARSLAVKPDQDPLTATFGYQVASAPIELDLSAGEVAGMPEESVCTGSDPGLSVLTSGLPRQKSVLVIVDDSWPDQAEYAKSRDFVLAASRLIRSRFRLDAAQTNRSNIDALESIPTTSFASGVRPYPEMDSHAAAIKAALQEYSCGGQGRGVTVVYLPLLAAQDGSLYALKEILYVAALARLKRGRLSSGPAASPASSDQIRIARDLSGVPFEASTGNVSGIQYKFEPGKPLRLQTDQALIEAIAFFMRLYSEATGEPHFMSMSWLVPNLEFQVYFPGDSYGLMLAAAGNSSGNVQRDRPQFAYRSSNPGDVIAVENSDQSGWLCSSSRLDPSDDIDVLGVGFSGQVQGTICGTSFSTPRVAWLLAAREAYVVDPTPASERSLWQARQKKRLLSLRNTQSNDASRFHMTWQKLLGIEP